MPIVPIPGMIRRWLGPSFGALDRRPGPLVPEIPVRIRRCLAMVAAAAAIGPGRASAQQPTIEETPAGAVGGVRSSLGTIPGTNVESLLGQMPGASSSQDLLSPPGGYFGGRLGPSVPRVPLSATVPGAGFVPPSEFGIAPTPGIPSADLPTYGPLDLPASIEDEGPPDGLTLDAAIDRLVVANPTLRAQRFELPQARADVLTAGLRANPILYADSQLIPYGSYSNQRPGGPVQYDLNITYPLDVTGKRRARVRFATRAVHALEAQYQNAVRLQIDNLYTAYVDALAARETVRLAEASTAGLGRITALSEELLRQGQTTEADVSRFRSQAAAASIALDDARASLSQTRHFLGVLLGIPPAEATSIELRGSIRDPIPEIPPPEELIATAIRARPDLNAYRLGIETAKANVDLARANRFSDVYVLYQPYTFQDNSPFGKKSGTSWALGVTVPLPIYNRNQGNIQRAQLNVSQTAAELEALRGQIVAEVRRADREYRVTKTALARTEAEWIPSARRVRDDALRLFRGGEVDALEYLSAERDFNEVVRHDRDLLVRHRRSMLDLNTAVGTRVLP